MQVKSIAECSKGSILQYFQPLLSCHLSLRPLFCLFFEWQFYTGFTVHHLILFTGNLLKTDCDEMPQIVAFHQSALFAKVKQLV